MKIHHHSEQGICVVSISEDVNYQTEPEIQRFLESIVDREAYRGVLIEELPMLDSHAISVLVHTYRQLKLRNLEFGLCNLSDHNRKLIAILKLDQVLKVHDSTSQALKSLRQTLGSIPSPAAKSSRPEQVEEEYCGSGQVFLATRQYFLQLQQQVFKGQLPASNTLKSKTTGMTLYSLDKQNWFDEYSIREALFFCEQAAQQFSQQSESVCALLVELHPFLGSSHTVLKKVIALFQGDWGYKEKLIRQYGSKIYGTALMIRSIVQTEALFKNLPAGHQQQIQQRLMSFLELCLSQMISLFPRALVGVKSWHVTQLMDELKATLTTSRPFIIRPRHYNFFMQKVRELMVFFYCHPGLQDFVEWRRRYLVYWLSVDLHRLDLDYLLTHRNSDPFYTPIKLAAYRDQENITGRLHIAPEQKAIRLPMEQHVQDAFASGACWMMEEGSPEHMRFLQARKIEKQFLETMNSSQLSLLAQHIHREITRQRHLSGKPVPLSELSTMRSSDLNTKASEPIVEDNHGVDSNAIPDVLINKLHQVLGQSVLKIKSCLHVFQPPKSMAKARAKAQVEAGISRALQYEFPLNTVQPDWLGWGKRYERKYYSPQVPNFQQLVFESGVEVIHLLDNYMELCETLFENPYLNKRIKTRSHSLTNHQGQADQQLSEIMLHYRIDADTFFVLGRVPFAKLSTALPYFQLYRKSTSNPIVADHGLDFSKRVGGVSYQLENFYDPATIRPLVFECLVLVMDSFPDSLRDRYLPFIEKLYAWLKAKGAFHFLNQRN